MPDTPNLSRRTSTVVLLQGEDEEQLSQLRSEARRLREARRIKDADAADATADEFATEAEERGVTVTLRAVGRKRWAELKREHPPREDHDGDKALGANIDTFPEAAIPACLMSPALNDQDREEFLDGLSFGHWDVLAWECWQLNQQFGADPKARLGSATTRS